LGTTAREHGAKAIMTILTIAQTAAQG